MAPTTTSPTPTDNELLNSLSAQVQANQASFDPTLHMPIEPTQFRIDHPRPSAISHPLPWLVPVFQLDSENSSSLRPAIRLYVHLLTRALPMFHTLIHRIPTLSHWEGLVGSQTGKTWNYPEPLNVLTREQEGYTWEFMGRIGKEVNWVVGEEQSGNGQVESRNEGFCTPQSDRVLQHAGLLGYGSTITTCLFMVQPLESAVQAGDAAKERWHSLCLAILWLHEFGHAVEMAIRPVDGQKYPVFLGSARTTKMGFEIENKIFGGQFSLTAGSLTLQVEWSEWPDWQRLRNYRKSKQRVEIKASKKELERAWYVMWDIKQGFVERMFEESFWRDAATLRPTKAIGLVVKGYAMMDEDWKEVKAEMEEQGFAVEDNGLVLKKEK